MKQVLLEIGSGEVSIGEVPSPSLQTGSLLVESRTSVISGGTEGMLVDFGRSGFIDKVRSQPDRVKRVLDKAATDGFAPTIAAVRDKLSETLSPGYCQAGVVVAVGDATCPFAMGDRVVTNGPHAEIVRAAYNLAARIPDGVDFETAAFTPLGAIALQGLRLAQPTLGETIVVFGLGLVGQLAVQIVRAHGCRCIGVDLDRDRASLARSFGAITLLANDGSVVDAVRDLTGGVGADAVLMALATDADEPIHQAAEMSRKRGRIVLVGVTGLDLRRADFFEKELSLQVSCSYGPGRYDPVYEREGRDYPLPFVRWTAQRNFEAVLQLMADGRLDTSALVTHRFPIGEAPAAYDLLHGEQQSLGILITYPARDREERNGIEGTTVRLRPPARSEPGRGVAGVIGAGNFARRTLLPALRAAEIQVRTIVSSTGLSAAVEGGRSEAVFASSDVSAVFDDPEIDTVFVLTRHDSHAEFAARALRAGKHVFVEKPLGLTFAALDDVYAALEGSGRLLTVGFNRRFAPLAVELRELVDGRVGPLSVVMTVNAGHVDRRHWVQDRHLGGGRIIGEACHFLDLARFLSGVPIADVSVRAAFDRERRPLDDVSHLIVAFVDGSTAAIHYLATGASRFPKERVEVFFDNKTASIDNWRRLRTWGLGRRDRPLPRRMDKGHEAELRAFAAAVRTGGAPPIPYKEILEVSRWSIRAAESARGLPLPDA